jgi:hypothetical protein
MEPTIRFNEARQYKNRPRTDHSETLMLRRDVPLALLAAAIAPSMLSSCNGAAESDGADGTVDNLAPTFPQTVQESANGVVPIDFSCRPGAWRRYGGDPNGRRDATSAIASACLASPTAFDDFGGTYLVSGPIHVPSNCSVSGIVNRTVLIMSNPDTSLFVADGTDGVTIQGIRFRVTAASAVALTGLVVFFEGSGCACRDCEFSGFSWAGVWMDDARDCCVERCYFHDSQGSVQDSADICVYNNASDNVVTDNRCCGGNYHGILVQNPYNDAFPSNNLVARNYVANHKAYGILVYVPDEGDTYNRILDNRVEDIFGTEFTGSSGAGICVAGQGGGGTLIDGNALKRCCIETLNRTESPGAIGIHGMTASNAPIAITNNVVTDMAQYDGILVIVSKAKVSVAGNHIELLAGNSGGTPVRLQLASNVSVTSNVLTRPASDGRCIFVYASGGPVLAVAVSSNICTGGDYNQIDFYADNAGYFEGISCLDNTCSGAGRAETASCISVSAVDHARVSGNNCASDTAVTFYMRDATNLVVENNEFHSQGPTTVVASGSCAGSVYAASNAQNGAIDDLAAGLLVE